MVIIGRQIDGDLQGHFQKYIYLMFSYYADGICVDNGLNDLWNMRHIHHTNQ